MPRIGQSRKKEIVKKRFRFFIYELFWIFLGVFALIWIPFFIIPLFISQNSVIYGILFYSFRAIIVLLAIPIILFLFNLVFDPQKRDLIIEEDVSAAMGHLKLYKMSKKNYKYQILYGILIFFLVFLPIDFFGYILVPSMLEYQAFALSSNIINIYLLDPNYFVFLISVIIIQLSVAISEETIFRGVITKRGGVYFFKYSAVLISALSWGLGHFAYFINPISVFYPFWYPIVWFIQAFFIGIILSLLILRRKWLIPAIIAHALNNIISAHAVWSLLQGNDFTIVGLYLYYPLLIIGCILFIWYYSKIKEGFSIGINMLKTYFKREDKFEKTTGDSIVRVLFDILIALIIFIMSFMVSI
ncbi:MAG: type II CAAX prenyl endopeptidase Rce1 family protein [Candidatus Thorarchaeota archaeon]